eukprot:4505770-Pyramimonas_sp.AAC.1
MVQQKAEAGPMSGAVYTVLEPVAQVRLVASRNDTLCKLLKVNKSIRINRKILSSYEPKMMLANSPARKLGEGERIDRFIVAHGCTP